MTAMRLRESAAYGLRLYAFLLGVTLLGGGALGLGLALAVPEATSLVGNGGPDTTELAAGGVLGFLGLTVLAVGYLGTVYKLIADAVATGSQLAVGPAPTTGASEPVAADSRADRGPEDGPAASDGAAATESQQAQTVESGGTAGVASGSQAPPDESADAGGGPEDAAAAVGNEEYGSRRTEGAPEPTPEEIAFGPSGDEETRSSMDDEGTDETEDRSEPSESGSVRPAGRNASSDPLADPTDDE